MRKRKISRVYIVGLVSFFFTITAVVSLAVLIFAAIYAKVESHLVIAVVMFCMILFLSLACTLLDLVRRKLMIDRPVRRILLATDEIASGDFSLRMKIDRSYKKYNEFDYIMENLNKMAAALSKTEVLHKDFISNVSHEMKTPVAIIQNYATLLQRVELDEQTRIKHAKTLAEASRRLSALVTNILNLNKLENQELKPAEYERVNLSEALAETVIGFEDLIEKKRLRLNCDFEEGVIIRSSSFYLETVWNNLISNAIKFTEAGGEIGVTLKKANKKAVVCVSDTGCGISAETGEHIFEKFYQGDTSHSQEGNGLGLALVKKVIDIIGGGISVESELGKGTAFTVTLNAED